MIRTSLTDKKSKTLLNEATKLRENVNIAIKLQIMSQKPAQGLSRIAEKEYIDLNVIENKGRRGINRLVMGSVSKKINEIAKTSVLT